MRTGGTGVSNETRRTRGRHRYRGSEKIDSIFVAIKELFTFPSSQEGKAGEWANGAAQHSGGALRNPTRGRRDGNQETKREIDSRLPKKKGILSLLPRRSSAWDTEQMPACQFPQTAWLAA